MPAGKLKNLILLILLLANGFLLALAIPSHREAALRRQQARTQLSELFADAGVTLSAEEIPATLELYPMETSCAAEDLTPAARAVLDGGEERTVASGVEVSTADGVCLLAPGGRLSATLRRAAADPGAETAELLRRFGGRWEDPTADGGRYKTRQILSGAPVLSHGMTFTFDGGDLVAAEGRILPEPSRSAATACCSAEDALTAFLSSRLDLGWMGSRVEAVTQGYALSDGAAQGAILLQPVWRIVTDGGVFQVDGITRTVTAD